MNIKDYIKETPTFMKGIITRSNQLFSEVKEQKIKRIIITGSGTSYHSGAQVQQEMRKLTGLLVETYYPFAITKELIGNDTDHTLFIGVSQGGSSYSTYNAMKLAKGLGCKIASVAGVENALIDEISDYILTVYCGEENAGPKTKGYYCTKLNLILLGLYIGYENGTVTNDEFDNEISILQKTTDEFLRIYHSALQWVENNSEDLKLAKEIRVIGNKELYGDTMECALKMLETFRIPVTGYEFEEFIHGIYNAITEDSTIILLYSGGDPRVDTLIEILSDWTKNIYVIGREVNYLENKNFVIENGDDNLYNSFVYPIAIQLLCATVPQLKGIDPSKPKDPNFHKKIGSKRIVL